MQIAYIAGPYRSNTINGISENIDAAKEVAKKYWLKGYMAFCPHTNSAFFDGLIPCDVILEGCLDMLRRCDVVVMMRGWENSEGAKAEFELASWLGKEIIFEEE